MKNGCKANPIIWMPDGGVTGDVPATTPAIEIPKTTPTTPIVEITA
jgi:hypothetical protein